jgi:hypothetical protein
MEGVLKILLLLFSKSPRGKNAPSTKPWETTIGSPKSTPKRDYPLGILCNLPNFGRCYMGFIEPKFVVFYLLEAHQQWIILLQNGLHYAILGSNKISFALHGMEALGTTEMQVLLLVDHSK